MCVCVCVCVVSWEIARIHTVGVLVFLWQHNNVNLLLISVAAQFAGVGSVVERVPGDVARPGHEEVVGRPQSLQTGNAQLDRNQCFLRQNQVCIVKYSR